MSMHIYPLFVSGIDREGYKLAHDIESPLIGRCSHEIIFARAGHATSTEASMALGAHGFAIAI